MYSSIENIKKLSQKRKKIKLGKINFINTEPLYFFLDKNKYKLISGAPKELYKKLLEENLDVAPVPSYAYLKNIKNKLENIFKLIKGISVSGSKEVMSVCLYSKSKDIKNIKRIYVTPLTTTSIELLKIILKRFHKNVKFTKNKKNADALLLIGDEALFFFKSEEKKIYKYKLDLAKAWYKLYKLPFIFAVFLLNKKKLKTQFFIKRDMKISKKLCYRNIDILVEKIIKNLNLETSLKSYLKKYYKVMNYDFSYKHYLSLKLFEFLST